MSFREDVYATRARVEALEPELAREETRLAAARERIDSSQHEIARRRESLKYRHTFSPREMRQLVSLLLALFLVPILLYFLSKGGRP